MQIKKNLARKSLDQVAEENDIIHMYSMVNMCPSPPIIQCARALHYQKIIVENNDFFRIFSVYSFFIEGKNQGSRKQRNLLKVYKRFIQIGGKNGSIVENFADL